MVYRSRVLLSAAAVCLAAAGLVIVGSAQTPEKEPNLTEEQQREFLLHAKVVNSRQIDKGITNPWRLTLSDGRLTHDAAFQSIDERKPVMQFPDGRTEINFRDSYHSNIAARELAKLLGLDNMVPVTVERNWQGNGGSLSWWVPWKWDAAMRLQQNLQPPDADAWNKQMYKARVFDDLIYDTDPNLGNVLITEDWKVWRIDFTRAFRLYPDLQDPKELVQCDRQLLEKLRQLSYEEVLDRTKAHLGKSQVKAVMARRDKIVAHFEKLIAEKGENAVLY
ncbi:MAG: hypothetical protein LAN62_08030 [Acidobacteriia bacterium]|nr:hypothetical protein [Terriglobia bacterium]